MLFLIDHFEFCSTYSDIQDANIRIIFYFIFLKTVGWKRISVSSPNYQFYSLQTCYQVEHISKKVIKCKLNIKFLSQCRDTNIIPNFTNLKKLKQMNKRRRFMFCRKMLCDEVSSNHKNLKEIRKQQQESQNLLKKVAT